MPTLVYGVISCCVSHFVILVSHVLTDENRVCLHDEVGFETMLPCIGWFVRRVVRDQSGLEGVIGDVKIVPAVVP